MFRFDEKLIPLDIWVNQFVDWLVEGYRWFFQGIKLPVELTLTSLENGLTAAPPILTIALIGVIAWKVASIRLAILTIASLVFIGLLGFWEDTMITLAMVFSSVVFCILAGIPLGIWTGRNKRVETIIRPVLDGMQTTPAFVYLVPIVMLFSIGNVAGVFATIVFSLPPITRLTALGIQQVHPELVEAALAFGATESQVLFKVQIPLAMPTIMAGLNQTIMMALSMVVIAALIGAGGLGAPVVLGLNTLDIGLATIGGLSIVLIAIILDRITQSMGKINQ